MGQQVIDENALSGGAPAEVYALLADGSTWPEWSPIGSFTLLEPGDGAPECPAAAGSTGASWARSSGARWQDWPRRPAGHARPDEGGAQPSARLAASWAPVCSVPSRRT